MTAAKEVLAQPAHADRGASADGLPVNGHGGVGATLPISVDRRQWLARTATHALGGVGSCFMLSGVTGCGPRGPRGPDIARVALPPARWIGPQPAHGHRLRATKSGAWPVGEGAPRRVDVLIVGAGIAGLAAARALRQRGIEDIALLESEPEAGGNSRAHTLAGMACPMGAHYLPVPGAAAREVQALLSDLGVARWVHGRWRYDERMLCHSPQERFFEEGVWHEGLRPPAEPGSRTEAHMRRFSQAVSDAQRDLGFAMPTSRAPWTPAHARLDARPFATWLAEAGIDDPRLLAHLDYACRDDYGGDAATVSAWAGIHYFASRHGFSMPGEDDAEREPVLTWPEGNGWLSQQLAAGLRERLRSHRLALAVSPGRHDVTVLIWNAAQQGVETWIARQVVLATPLFIAARLWQSPPAALTSAAQQIRRAPWLVANLHLDAPLLDRPGAPPAWDNVSAGSRSLGYVDAMHQSLRPHAGPTVLTSYWALPEAERTSLLSEDPRAWAQRVVDDLAQTHPDLPRRVQSMDLARWAHAMCIPTPGVRGSAALSAIGAASLAPRNSDRVRLAHADLSGYSVFEEAYHWGWGCGQAVGAALRGE